MLELSWIGVYLLLHLALAAVASPCLMLIERCQQQVSAQWMLRLWTFVALLLFLLPVLLLLPLAAENNGLSKGVSRVLPWYQAVIPQVQHPTGMVPMSDLAATSAADGRSYHFQLLPQLLHLVSPALWFWLLLPLVILWQQIRFVRCYLATRRLVQQAFLLPQAQATALQLPGHQLLQDPQLLQHAGLQSAVLVGIRQPKILLPSHWLQQLPLNQLRHVVVHEHCHWRLHDLPAFYLQQLAALLCCWSPFWYLINNRLNRYRELRCDELVLHTLAEPQQYAQTLLDCYRQQQPEQRGFFAMAWQQPLLATRIQRVLRQSQNTADVRHFSAALLLLLLLLGGTSLLAQQAQVATLPRQYGQLSLTQLKPLTALLHQVEQGDLAATELLVHQGAPLNAVLPGKGSALMQAVRQQNLPMVALLLRLGAEVNLASRGSGNALIIAVQQQNLPMAKLLVAAGADVNAVVLADETALITASSLGDVEMVQYLLSVGALLNLRVEAPLLDGRELRSALTQAANPQMLLYLQQQGAQF